MTGERVNPQILSLGEQDAVSQETGATITTVRATSFQSSHLKPRIDKMEREQLVRRLWEKDGSLWKKDPGNRQAYPRASDGSMLRKK